MCCVLFCVYFVHINWNTSTKPLECSFCFYSVIYFDRIINILHSKKVSQFYLNNFCEIVESRLKISACEANNVCFNVVYILRVIANVIAFERERESVRRKEKEGLHDSGLLFSALCFFLTFFPLHTSIDKSYAANRWTKRRKIES